MRSRPYERFLPHGDLQRSQWELLERFRPVWLHADPDERRRLAAMIDDPRMRAGVLRYGLAEYLGGAVLAIARLHAGESEHPLGAAMVHAAADWRRVGLDAVPEPVLARLARRYLPEPGRRGSADRTARAIEWASEPIDHTVALLEPTAGGWRAFDPVVDHLAAEGRPVPDAVWNAALRSAGDRLIAVCHAAAAVHHRQDVAERAWRRALERHGDTAVLTARLLRDLRGSAPTPRGGPTRRRRPTGSGRDATLTRRLRAAPESPCRGLPSPGRTATVARRFMSIRRTCQGVDACHAPPSSPPSPHWDSPPGWG